MNIQRDRLASGLAHLELSGARVLLRLIIRRLFQPLRPVDAGRVRHIVIYRVGNIGDTVVAIPAMAAIRRRFPQARLTLLTSAGRDGLPGAADALAAFPCLVDGIAAYLPGDIRSVAGLNRLKAEIHAAGGPVDAFIELPVSLQNFRRAVRGIFLARWLDARSAFGFEPLLPEVFRNAWARQAPGRIPRTADWLLAVACGEEADMLENDRAFVRSFFHPPALDWTALGLDPARPLLAVNAGAKLAIKRWPPERFHAVLARLLTETPDLQVALLGNEDERSLNERIAEDLPGTIANLCGRLTLHETWALLDAATAALSSDTGVMHMAGLLGKPVFAPTSGQYPAPLWHPPGGAFTAFRHAVPCAPCFYDACPLPEQPCFQGIDAEAVAAALNQSLESVKDGSFVRA